MPRLGDFGVCPGKGWAEWLVRLGTFSRFGHACVAVTDTDADGRLTIVEAMPNGARRRTVDHTEFLWSRCDLTAEQRTRIADDAIACVGIPYDLWAIWGFVVRFWGAKLRKQSADHADAKMICSELATWCYRRAGHEVAPSSDVACGDVSPGDLGQHITAGEGE
jgi:uncharacterized protein YycO